MGEGPQAEAGAEARLLAEARAGQREAFDRVTGPHLGALHRLCYRMLGSVVDADDALQEALIRAWDGLHAFEARSSFRAWLSTIATRCAIDQLRRNKRVELTQGELEPAWLQPYPTGAWALFAASPQERLDEREDLSLAYTIALQHLAPRQRAVLVLRRVVGLSAQETGDALEMTVPAVNSALQRAGSRVDAFDPERRRPATPQELRAVERFIEVWQGDDPDALVALLREDVILTMPPQALTIQGAAAVVQFLRDFCGGSFANMLSLTVEVGGGVAFAGHLADGAGRYPASGILLPEARADRITRLTVFGPELYARMGLPTER